ncbi:MAG: methyl-accepting chemotaxis protein [Spirochaetaceae bacterium]|nr:methyl-accepting chemotaxis protein [Spirochaetaceae bacterium]
MVTKLTPVVKIDEDKCNNCYACIAACPAKLCMDGSGEKLQINPNLCIGCGCCVDICGHGARQIIDDEASFYEELKQGGKIVAVVAPAIASFFPGEYLNFNGYLKSLGIEAIFDVGFGAELTVASYLDHIKEKKPRMVISQPCPAIVNFIQIYHPELLPYLAPMDSPILHIIKMIRKYYPQYNNHKIAVVSPCIAKRREFDETGFADYNVTMLALKERMAEHNVHLSSFPKVEYEGPLAERAVRFPSPGGLLETAERFQPGIRRRTVKIEGVHVVYPYMEEISELLNSNINLPLLLDCLNCEKGCNGGPGTGNAKVPSVVLENAIHERSSQLEEFHKTGKRKQALKKYHKLVKQYWQKDLYNRSYHDYSANNNLKSPNEAQLAEVYRSFGKYKPEDIYDCPACGYGTCKAMATAIFNKLNKPQNCAHYNMDLLEKEKEHMAEIFSALKNISSLLQQQLGIINELGKDADTGKQSMKETIESVQEISRSMDGIDSAIKIISDIATNTSLLSINASIEAAHAGAMGKGFAVVAGEIRRLSETTGENSQNISKTLSGIIDGINLSSTRSTDTDNLISDMSEKIKVFAAAMTELITNLSELSADSSEII